MSVKLKLLLIAVSCITLIWVFAFYRAPRLSVRLIDMWIEPRDNYWINHKTLSEDLKQLAIKIEVINNYDKDIKLFTVYSRKLAQLSLQSRLINDTGHITISSKSKKQFTINYLLKEEIPLNSIVIEKDFLACSSFNSIVTAYTVENSWQGYPIIAPLFGIGYSKIRTD